MKIKKVKIGIKSVEEALEDAKKVMKKLEQGEKVKKESRCLCGEHSPEKFLEALLPVSSFLIMQKYHHDLIFA